MSGISLPLTGRPAPLYFKGLALSVPSLITGQLFLAGVAIFSDGTAWEWHRTMGGVTGLPILLLCGLALWQPSLRPYRMATGIVFLLYVLQIVWLTAGRRFRAACCRRCIRPMPCF
ncbi:DUF6220 domain-containing protein [Rhizobium sp. 32-5/1]|uniref:DUF6220 domain-containing protein n=1 Tax=Rhizobium sp. 32-5/1 TaxID=3019602 RepID=UPI00240E8AEF|nr:DUF6220 domain-containing protein [Rhizobium sp. 32-5/1]WEZ82962.1 DUF6220 domain-containing protein [Rhizobium sp. 32-5/1]